MARVVFSRHERGAVITQRIQQSVHSWLCLGFLVLLTPVLEFLFFRIYLRNIVGARVGWPWYFTDMDVFFPFCLGFLICFGALYRGKTVSLRKQQRLLYVHGILVGLLVLLCSFFHPLVGLLDRPFVVFLLAFSCVVMMSGFSLFIEPSFYLRNPNSWVMFPAALIAFAVVIFHHSLQWYWEVFGQYTSITVCYLATLLGGDDVVCRFVGERGDGTVRLTNSMVGLLIAKKCGGGEGMFVLFLTSLIIKLSVKEVSFSRWALYTIAALPCMFLLNVVRILLILGLGTWLVTLYDYDTADRVMKTFFHAYLGWLLYGAFLILFYRLLAAHPKKKSVTLQSLSLIEVSA